MKMAWKKLNGKIPAKNLKKNSTDLGGMMQEQMYSLSSQDVSDLKQ